MPGVEAKVKEKDEMVDFDKENSVFLKELMRPAEIKEDVKLMEQRKRVSKILKSEAFHKELDKILDQQLKEGAVCGGKAGSGTSSTIAALQEISNLLLPQAKLGCSVFNRGATMPIIPINDIKSNENFKRPEKLLRCKLATIYRLIDLYGWANGMQLHASIRSGKDADTFLTSVHGLMNHEVQASNVIKININGEDEEGEIGQIDYGAWLLHAAIHKLNDSNSRCVIFVKTPAVVAVSCMKSGLMKLCEDSIKVGKINTYTWGSSTQTGASNGSSDNGSCDNSARINEEQTALGNALDNSSCVLIRNTGILARGRTVEEAWQRLSWAVQACEIQVRLTSSLGGDNLLTVQQKMEQQISENKEQEEEEDDDEAAVLQYEGLMRLLDATGHRTGHLYRHAPISVDRNRNKQQDDGNLADKEDGDEDDDEDVEVPPSATSFSTQPMDSHHDSASHQTDATKTSVTNGDLRGPSEPRWLVHMPNDYVREEIEEPSRSGVKTTVTWRQLPPDSKITSGCVEPCTSANQFAPLGSDPNELKQQQMKVKAKYFTDVTTAGHKSKVFSNLTDDVGTASADHADHPAKATAAGKQSDDSTNMPGGTEDHPRMVLVGAVSKGIIDKKHRQDPSVYQSYFSPNPFDRVTEEDLKEYERKVMGLPPLHAEQDNAPTPGISVTETPDVIVPQQTVTVAAAPTQASETGPVIAASDDDRKPSSAKELTTSVSAETGGAMLSPTPRGEQIRSDTSGADMSHDDTEKEGGGNKSSSGGKKKKKKFRDMFSFRKKDKSLKEGK